MIALDFGFGPLEGEFWRLLFVMTRIGAALVAAPMFGIAGVPAQVRVIVAGAVAVLVCAWSPVAAPPALLSLPGLLAVAVDPNSGTQSPALGQYFAVVMTMVFLALGAHLQWFALLVDSYRAFPPGQTWLGPERFALVASFAARTFVTGAAIALPACLVLMVVQVVTGVLGRSAPALNLFALGLPAGVLGGLAALLVSAPVLTDLVARLSAMAIDQAALVLQP